MTVYLKHVNIATKRVARDLDWTHLCDRWEQEDFMSRSEANTNARFKLPFTHRDDTATFLRHKQKKWSGHVKGQSWSPRLKNARNEAIQQSIKEINTQIAHLQSIVKSQQATIEAILIRLTCQEAISNIEWSSEQSNDSEHTLTHAPPPSFFLIAWLSNLEFESEACFSMFIVTQYELGYLDLMHKWSSIRDVKFNFDGNRSGFFIMQTSDT
uniref:CACTA en-spm transposon protein n=1 Tax=Cucumis melo TaxID=3656 RepID=A0A9I9EJ75_CUCME